VTPTPKGNTPVRFYAFDVSLDLIRSLKEPVAKIRRHDANLADQVRRAATSVALNLKEGSRRQGRDRLHLFRIAAGSANEVDGAPHVALAWDYVELADVSEALRHADRELGMLYALTHWPKAGDAPVCSRRVT
jgi:four helix bundle protein